MELSKVGGLGPPPMEWSELEYILAPDGPHPIFGPALMRLFGLG